MKKYVKAARVGREKEIYVVQEYTGYGYGWEDVCTYGDTSSQSLREAKQDVKDYIDNGYSARIITRRVPNPDYVEPVNEMSWQMVEDYFTGDKAGLIKDKYSDHNYLIGDRYPNQCQVIEYSDGSVVIYNIGTNRTKQIYNIQQFESAINKIINK